MFNKSIKNILIRNFLNLTRKNLLPEIISFNYHKLNIIKNLNLLFTCKKNIFKKTNTLRRTRNIDFYEILGVEKGSSVDQIKLAYLKLVKQYHPDVNKDSGSDDKFKTISIAYEALSNKTNKDAYDSHMKNDPSYEEWNYWKDEEDCSKKERAKYDKNSGNFYRGTHDSNFWRGERETFEEKFYKDYDNIFNSGYTQKKEQKGEDILGVKFARQEKCKTCNGLRSASGTRPSKCFVCNATGESKKCNQCRGTGYIIKFPCGDCAALGIKLYNIEQIINIPIGIKSGTNIRFEKMGNCSENKETINGDLIIKINIEEDLEYKRINDDLVSNFEISLKDAIFGAVYEIINHDGAKKIIEIYSGTQSEDKIYFKGLV